MVDEYLRVAPGVFCLLTQMLLACSPRGLGDASAGSPATGQIAGALARCGRRRKAMQQAEAAAWNIYAQLSGLSGPCGWTCLDAL